MISSVHPPSLTNLGVSDEVETCIPSPVASPDLNDVTTCSSEAGEALSHVESALSHAYAVLEHSLTYDIKLHPSDKSHLNSRPSPKSPFDKVAPVQCGSSTHNLYPTLYTGKKEKYLNCSGDKALGDENTCQLMISPLISQGSIDQSPSLANHYSHAQSLVSPGCAYRPSILSSKSLSIPVSHDENAHYGVPCSPFPVPSPTDMDKPQSYKWNPGTKKLYGCDMVHPGPTASCLYRDKTLLAKAYSQENMQSMCSSQ